MSVPGGKASPDNQARIEELRQHLQELVDEMAFYQIRWDSLAREGNEDASRELRFFSEGFSELEAEAMDLENQLHELERQSAGDQAAFQLPKQQTPVKVDRNIEKHELIKLQKEELKCIEELNFLQNEYHEDVSEQLTQLRFRLDYIRKEIADIYGHH